MSPVYLNPQHSSSIPFLELKGDQQHTLPLIMGYVHDHVTSTTTNNNNTYFSRSSFENEITSNNEVVSMDYSRFTQDKAIHPLNHGDQGNNIKIVKSDQKPKKCKESKVRIIQKTMSTTEKLKKIMTRDHKHGDHVYLHARPKNRNEANNNNNFIRMCTDCHTTTTPLWRSGPHGPKSLCNACGIRQRKARRAAAMALASSTTTFAMDNGPSLTSPMSSTTTTMTTTTTIKPPKPTLINLDYHETISHTLPLKKRSKTFNQVYSKDEEEGALLLMALSRGLPYYSS
ncbi:hypothetical protein vseg_005744 [Gypsophila vaccaria]